LDASSLYVCIGAFWLENRDEMKKSLRDGKILVREKMRDLKNPRKNVKKKLFLCFFMIVCFSARKNNKAYKELFFRASLFAEIE
jgi:hypothetical protein